MNISACEAQHDQRWMEMERHSESIDAEKLAGKLAVGARLEPAERHYMELCFAMVGLEITLRQMRREEET